MSIVRPPCDEGIIRAGSAGPQGAPSARHWILAATILGSSLAFIDASTVNVALPALQESLGATVIEIQWVVNAYTLFLASLILLGGSLGDHYGRTRVFTFGVVVFTLASVWCGLSPTAEQLILARALQGIGGALLVPGSLVIISASFPQAERGAAIGLWSGFSAITSALGPVLGGWLIDTFSWRWIFFINVPLALIVIAVTLRHVPESRDPQAKRLDLEGAALVTLGLGGLTYGLLEGSNRGFGNAWVLVALGLGVLALALFVRLEARLSAPMVPLSLFKSKTFSGANLLTLCLYGALSGALFFLPLNLIQVQGYSATAAGAALLPFVLLLSLLSRWSGGLVSRVGAKLPLMVGPGMVALGLLLFMRPGVEASYPTDSVVGVIDGPEELQAALTALQDASFDMEKIETLCGEAGIDRLDRTGEGHGLAARLLRLVQYLGEEQTHLQQHEQELNAGHFLIVVPVGKGTSMKGQAKDILRSHGGHSLHNYGRFAIEDL